MKHRNFTAGIVIAAAVFAAGLLLPAANPSLAAENTTDQGKKTETTQTTPTESSKEAAENQVSDLNVRSEAMSVESIKLTWPQKDEIVKWQVEMAKIGGDSEDADAEATADTEADATPEYKMIRSSLKKTETTITEKGLAKNTTYKFRVTGFVSKNGKTQKAYQGETENYTGIAAPEFEEDAAAYGCSTSAIEVAIHSSGTYGLIEGYQIERRVKDETGFKVIGEIADSQKNKSGAVVFKDGSVKAGETYEYQARAFVGNNFSEYSEDMLTLSAVNHQGIYKTKEIRRSVGEMVVSLTSDKDNGTAVFDRSDVLYIDGDENEEGIRIAAYSSDGKEWTKLEVPSADDEDTETEVTLKPGKTVYLKFVPCQPEDLNLITVRNEDGKVPSVFKGDGVVYNRVSCAFKLDRNGESTAGDKAPAAEKTDESDKDAETGKDAADKADKAHKTEKTDKNDKTENTDKTDK